MKIFYIELFSIINISFLIIPLWNLEKSSIDILSEKSSANLTIYNKKKNASQVILIKNIFRNENNITEQNYIIAKICGHLTTHKNLQLHNYNCKHKLT